MAALLPRDCCRSTCKICHLIFLCCCSSLIIWFYKHRGCGNIFVTLSCISSAFPREIHLGGRGCDDILYFSLSTPSGCLICWNVNELGLLETTGNRNGTMALRSCAECGVCARMRVRFYDCVCQASGAWMFEPLQLRGCALVGAFALAQSHPSQSQTFSLMVYLCCCRTLYLVLSCSLKQIVGDIRYVP